MRTIDESIEAVIQHNAPILPLPYNYNSKALEASCVIKSSSGYLYGFTVYSNKGSAQFIQWFDAAALPADGAIPRGVISVATIADKEMIWIPPRFFTAGIVLCNSSTAATKTIGSADCFFDVQFV